MFADDGTGASVARVAQRDAVTPNLVYKRLRNPRYAPKAPEERTQRVSCRSGSSIGRRDDSKADACPVPAAGTIEFDIAGGQWVRIRGSYDPEALARLIC